MNVVVVGAGAWGSVFAALLRDRGHRVVLGCRNEGRAHDLAPVYEGIDVVAMADAPVGEADLVVVAVPSVSFAPVVGALKGNVPVLSLTKGLDPLTGARLSTLIADRLVAVLSGPNLAQEVSGGLPAAAVVASSDRGFAAELQAAITSALFRVYVNDDIVGVELCAAAKNVIALAAGAVDGLGLGDNAKAALVTRGLAEMARLAGRAGGRPETFAGLAGLGDLAVTCWSPLGRNRRAGELLAAGRSAQEAAVLIGTVEGITTAPLLARLAHELGVEMPITEAVCAALAGAEIAELVPRLMSRDPTTE
jgi:glycerol-3-phosphate dehydrogenase (NAD(P)+)